MKCQIQLVLYASKTRAKRSFNSMVVDGSPAHFFKIVTSPFLLMLKDDGYFAENAKMFEEKWTHARENLAHYQCTLAEEIP